MTEYHNNLSPENIIEKINGITHIEQWKPVHEYELFYEVSDFGRIRRLKRVDNIKHVWHQKIIKSYSSHGYRRIALTDANKTQAKHQVHRLVGIAFVDNPKNYPQINHKNGIRWDNRSWMLEWATCSENHKHAYHVLNKKANTPQKGKFGEMHFASIPVLKVSLDGFIIEQYGSQSEAARKINSDQSTIRQYISKQKTYKGFYLK